MTTARTVQGTTKAHAMYMVLALGWDDWTVGFTVGLGQAPRQVSVRARDLPGLLAQLAQAKRRFGIAADGPVHCVYEAGRAGCWLHRFLRAHGIQNVVVDASSIEGNRRYRRSKTDKLDVRKLLTIKSGSCASSPDGPWCSARARTWKMRRPGWSATTSSTTWSRCGR